MGQVFNCLHRQHFSSEVNIIVKMMVNYDSWRVHIWIHLISHIETGVWESENPSKVQDFHFLTSMYMPAVLMFFKVISKSLNINQNIIKLNVSVYIRTFICILFPQVERCLVGIIKPRSIWVFFGDQLNILSEHVLFHTRHSSKMQWTTIIQLSS